MASGPDSKLYVAMNLSFACSLRMRGIPGLSREKVHISDEDIAADNAYVYIDKELTRASKRAIETPGEKDIYYIFTPLMPNTVTRIIPKKPKTGLYALIFRTREGEKKNAASLEKPGLAAFLASAR